MPRRPPAGRVSECSTFLHRVETTITEISVFAPGRPPKNGLRTTVSRFLLSCQINEDKEAVEREQTMAGCFVLVTTLPAEGEGGMDARAILSIYKGQHCVEQHFAFLKDPLVVNDLFLKTPARIEVLGMILILALLVWRLMERSLRLSVENEGETLPQMAGKEDGTAHRLHDEQAPGGNPDNQNQGETVPHPSSGSQADGISESLGINRKCLPGSLSEVYSDNSREKGGVRVRNVSSLVSPHHHYDFTIIYHIFAPDNAAR